MTKATVVISILLLFRSSARAENPGHDRIEHLSNYLCALQKKLRYGRGPAWTKDTCSQAAEAYIEFSGQYKVHYLLGIAISIQESDLVNTRDREEGGLMGIQVYRGYTYEQLLDIPLNIQAGFIELRNWKDTEKRRRRRCGGSRTHEWWLHYNNGTKISPIPWKRDYANRVRSIYMALSEAFQEEPVEITMKNPKKTVDRRTKNLVTIIKNPALRPTLSANF